MRKSKFGGVQEVACAARKNQDTLLGLLQRAAEKLSWRHAAARAQAGFSG